MDKNPRNIYLKLLRKAVENKAQFRIQTSKDFQRLSEAIAEDGVGYLSSSTLKRFWGYVKDTAGKHSSTLDILARYAGYPGGYGSFVSHCTETDGVESGYESMRVLDVFSLQPGIKVEVGWLPDRRIVLNYTGNCTFRVEVAENTKIQKGWLVRCSRLIDGESLMMDILDETLQPSKLYEAGKINGISWVLLEA